MKKYRPLQLLIAPHINDFPVGSHRSQIKGSGDDFDAVREWQPGDRRIALSATTRTGTVMSRVFQELKELHVWVLVDTSHSMYFGSTTAKIDVANVVMMALSLSAIGSGDALGIVTCDTSVHHYIPLTKDVSACYSVGVDIMKHRPPIQTSSLTPALEYLANASPRNALICILSDFLTPLSSLDERLISTLTTESTVDVLALVIEDTPPPPLLLKPPFMIDVRDAENDIMVKTSGRFSILAQEELNRVHAWHAHLIQTFSCCQCSHLFLEIRTPYLHTLARHFSRKVGKYAT